MLRRIRSSSYASSGRGLLRRIGALAAALLLWAIPPGCGTAKESSQPVEKAGDTERGRVRNFWSANREASRLRLAGKYEAAAELYRECLELKPKHEDSLYYFGATLEEMGEYEQAEAAYRRIIEGNPSSNRAVAQLARLLAEALPGRRPRREEARALLERGIELNREHSGPYLSLGRIALEEGRFSEALKRFETAAGFGSAEGRLMAGYTLLLQGKDRAAAESFEKVLDAERQERLLAARGGKQEGDVAGGGLLASAGVRARLFLRWSAGGAAQPDGAGAARDLTKRAGLRPGGGRASWADFDGDGWTDAAVGGEGAFRLYRNRRGKFDDVAAASGLGRAADVWDSCWGDFEGDGDLDLYLIRPGLFGAGRNQLFRNNGSGSFSDVTAGTGLEGGRSTFRCGFVDLDGDDIPELVEVGAAGEGRGGVRIFHSGEGKWREVSSAWGVEAPGVVVDFAAADYDGDGRIDLFLLPWKKPVRLYRNEAAGRFVDVTARAGLSEVRGLGFSALFFDFDQDGRVDLFLSGYARYADAAKSMAGEGGADKGAAHRLFRNAGGARFEPARIEGLDYASGTVQAAAADLDGDGRQDLVLANGGFSAQRLEASVVLWNRSGGAFEARPLSRGGGRALSAAGVSMADVNNDSRPEIYLAAEALFGGGRFGAGVLLESPPSVRAR